MISTHSGNLLLACFLLMACSGSSAIETEVLVGSIVLVAGAAFMVSTAGAGVLVLIPLAAL